MARTHDANGLPLPRTPKATSPVRDPENERLHAENDALRHELAQVHTHMNRMRDLHASEIDAKDAEIRKQIGLKQWHLLRLTEARAENEELRRQNDALRGGMAVALTQAA